MFSERITGETELLSLLFLTVDRSQERAALDSQNGLCSFGVSEIAAPVRVATSLEHAARGPGLTTKSRPANEGVQRTVTVRMLTMNSLPVPCRAQMLTAY